MDDVDGEELLRRSIEGDSDAFGTLLGRVARGFRQRLRTRIPQRFQSAFDEYDVMQVTYIEAFRHIQALRGRNMPSFERWLYRIAYHNLQDALRSLEGATRPPRRRQLALSADQDSHDSLVAILGFTTTTPRRQAAKAEQKSLLDAAIDKLPEDYAAVVRLYDIDGLTGPEVAEAMGRSRGAVYMLRARAHAILTELLGTESQFFTRCA